MPTLTLEALRQNPWNVLTHELPAHPSRHLLALAQIAATCCREIEANLFHVACEEQEDSTLNSEATVIADRFFKAHRKIGEIIGLLVDNHGIAAEEIMLTRNSS